jgi:hypothetical protein
MQLNDPRWKALKGGRREPYDPSADLAALASGKAAVWRELWDKLHHQGDVGTASYAAVIALVEIYTSQPRDYNFYGLINAIELCRLGTSLRRSPAVPDWLEKDYFAALRRTLEFALQDVRTFDARSGCDDKETLKQMLATIALGKGAITIGRVLVSCTNDEISELADEQ